MPRPASLSRRRRAARPPGRRGSVHHVALLDALRHRRGDAEIERAVEIADDVLAGEILRRVGQPLLEAGMHMGADNRGHHGLAGEIDPGRAGGRRHLAAPPNARDQAALDQDRRILDRRAAVAGNDAGALEQRLRGRRLRHERSKEKQGEQRDEVAEHGRPVRLRLDRWSSNVSRGAGVVKVRRPNRCTR